MPTIAFISPKGGVGKTTAALLLASQLARGARVSVIDADPNHPIASWAKGTALPDNLSIVADVDEDNILDRIEEAAASTPFVIVDLEGTAAKIVLLSRSSPVIRTRTMGHIQEGLTDAGVPMFTTQLHEREAFRAIFSFRQTLEALDPREVANLDKAIANAEQFAVEVIERLRQSRSKGARQEDMTA